MLIWKNRKNKSNHVEGKESLSHWDWKEYLRNVGMILLKVPIWLVQYVLIWIPIKRNRIIIYSLKQHGYSCNLKYLTEYIRENYPDDFTIMWIVKDQNNCDLVRGYGVDAEVKSSLKHFWYRMRAGIVITNDEFYPMFIKKPGQIYVNTWHGGINYKKIGYEGLEFTNRIQKFIYKIQNPCPDLFVSGSKEFTDTTSSAFHFPKKVFCSTGLLRNDIFFTGEKERKEKAASIKKKIGIDDSSKILLYAPTYRRGDHSPVRYFQFDSLRKHLSKRFGGEWIILIRQHYFVKSESVLGANVKDVSNYEDMQELMLCSDCMISDYSSCMWDFSLMEKPCFAYTPDLEDYLKNDRSFFIPMVKWPYPICQTPEELYIAIDRYNEEEYLNKIQEHRKQCISFDRGKACESLTEYLLKYCRKEALR